MFVARYLKKCPIALDRLAIDDSATEPSITCVRKLDDGEQIRSFTPLEFLAELSAHIPNTWEQTTRFYGCYAARSRKLLSAAKSSLQDDNRQDTKSAELEPALHGTPKAKPASSYWATWIKKVYEVDPLTCKKCGAQMKIIAFLHNSREIEKIADHLGIQRYRAPPEIRKSNQQQIFVPELEQLQFQHFEN